MESTQRVTVLEGKKLGLWGILKEALKIPFMNPNFIISSFITSLPVFCSLFLYESLYVQTITEAVNVLQTDQDHQDHQDLDRAFCFSWDHLKAVDMLLGRVSHNFVLLVILHLGILHFFDLFNTITIVNSASDIYAGDNVLTLKQMFIKHVMDTRIKGPLVTSIFVVLLTSLLSTGLISIALYAYITYYYPLFMMLFVTMFVALLVQHVKWSAVWNMGTLISILEYKEGNEALLVSAYISRGNRLSGSLLMLVYVVWRLCLRLGYYFMAWNSRTSRVWISIVYVSLVCVANGLKWVAFVVYFKECRKWSSVTQVSQSV
ncbi:hypothetical protein QN277_013819 [Acacia crassicarpa]|uniref:Uncharacterized protein n=1 Tax=Acacia crassicarpa TaxID=499986 RepID=A0AAE1TF25_9FABA|nr:hypothetical protein QN277_013819 [Acacia crassicarpa]